MTKKHQPFRQRQLTTAMPSLYMHSAMKKDSPKHVKVKGDVLVS